MLGPTASDLHAAVDGPLDPRRRRARRMGGPDALIAAERAAVGRTGDRLARDLVAGIAAARQARTAPLLVARLRALTRLRAAAPGVG